MTKLPHQNLELIRRVLADNYLDLRIKSLNLEEDFDNETSTVTINTVDVHDNIHKVEGKGCGVVDAIWVGLLEVYAREYQSLRSIELERFSVQANLDTKKRDNSGTDAVCEVSLLIRNSEGNKFSFADESRSIVTSSARAVLAGIEYFVNAERAFVTLHRSLQDAKERNRSDLITRYTQEIAEVVKSTSYTEVIEALKKEL